MNSQFVSNSLQNTQNNGIAAIGISSSFLPPLAEDSEEFGGFEPNSVSSFVSGNNGNFAGASVTQSTPSQNRFDSSSSNVNGNRFNLGGNVASSVGRAPSTAGTNTAFNGASSRLVSAGASNNGFVKGLGNVGKSDGDYKVLRQEGEVNEDGYHYLYETENKIQAEETGRVLNKGTDDAHIEATGFFEYVGPDGVTYRVDYTADENGFQATVSGFNNQFACTNH